jgi:hypothetical protein
MRKTLLVVAAAVVPVACGATLWRRDRRIGTRLVNEVLDPFLLRRGLSGAGRSELGTLEHIGRRSGIRRLTPVHPVATAEGFRIIVPLGERSEWARNVLAAGGCRIQLHDTVHELDEPALLAPDLVPGLTRPARWLGSWLGFRYLVLHRVAQRPGSLAAAEAGTHAGDGVEEAGVRTEEPVAAPT